MIRIGILQTNIYWENISANLQHLDTYFNNIRPNGVDVILLPEMFTTGFSMNAAPLAEVPMGPSMKWMHQQANTLNAAVGGSLILKNKENHYTNSFVFMLPNGHYTLYNKRHLFRMGKENKVYKAGQQQQIVEWRNWRFAINICYDLRFPVWSRRSIQHNYDCLINVANWPAIRDQHWQALLQARAIENQAYVIGVNRVGEDANSISYCGSSVLINYKGQIAWLANAKEQLRIFYLDKKLLQKYRKNFPAHLDADPFKFLQ